MALLFGILGQGIKRRTQNLEIYENLKGLFIKSLKYEGPLRIVCLQYVESIHVADLRISFLPYSGFETKNFRFQVSIV
jgi:hypothetical protein